MNNSQLALYEALRSHIVQKEEEIASETVYMYVAFFALLVAGQIWSEWVSLVSFLALIVFQSLINESLWSIVKASIYIRVFFEAKDKDIQWESLHIDPFYSSVRDAESRNLGWYICKSGVTILSGVSFLYILISVLSSVKYSIGDINEIQYTQIVVAFVLCAVAFYLNRIYFKILNPDSSIQKKLLAAIVKFKNSGLNP